MILVIVAELRIAIMAGVWLTGQPEEIVAAALVGAVAVILAFGGMRSLSWSNTAESLAVLLALIVPAALIGSAVTNLPIPQLSTGPVLRALGRLEAAQHIPFPVTQALTFNFADVGLDAITQRFAQPFGVVGSLSFPLASLTIMAGIAAAPWLLPRIGTTPGIYETRKSIGWATFTIGAIALTLSADAVLMRDMVMTGLADQSRNQLPLWFQTLENAGLAAVDGLLPRLPLSSFTFNRDAVLIMLPIARGYPAVMTYLALAGVIAAAVAATSMSTFALGASLSEDVVSGLKWEPAPGRLRLLVSRGCVVAAALFGGGVALVSSPDPLALFFWAVALSGSSLFPVLVLSIWWKRINAFGALVGLSTGFGVAVLAILAGETTWFGVDSALAGAFGIPAGFAATVVATMLRPSPGRQILELVREMRVPGGETVHDREMRLLRLKQRQRF
jgi:cation/acetate symporter